MLTARRDPFCSEQDFFIRKHKEGTRPITAPDDPTIAVISADSRIVTYPTVTLTKQLWIKGYNFSIAQLIDDPVKAKTWEDGAIASYRLSPQDYHRYHCPVRGTVKWWKELDGDYYEVDGLALQSSVRVDFRGPSLADCCQTRTADR